MKIEVIQVDFHVLGQAHKFYDLHLKPTDVYESEIQKIHQTACICSIGHALVTEEEYIESSFQQLKAHNRQLEERFDHIDKEALS